MCGIIGVVGSSDTLSTLLEGLQRLEYRGYDSAGVALVRPGQTWRARAADGTQSVAALRLECEHAPSGFSSGIGHTRWATHGAPEAVNAHPHLDCSGNIAIIHNGIIENHSELQEQLESRGHVFTSVTDSEVLAHLIEEERAKGLELIDAVRQSLLIVRGAFALAVMDANEPDVIVAARRISPLVVGTSPGVTYLASDIPAILDKADVFYAVNDDEVVRLAQLRQTLAPSDIDALFQGLNAVSAQVAKTLTRRGDYESVAEQLLTTRDFFFLGRHVGFPTALEGALKLKELSYLHAEGYPAGELKHGPLALIEPGVVVVAITTDPNMHEKILSNLAEVKARGATVVAVATDDDEKIAAVADFVFRVPATEPMFTPIFPQNISG